ncbi:hypothetical protein L3Y34_009673 [Caenorhabditis briggsae]|uniref:Uncharacterized protein n=2 Tax=Caenorhabditis briggsae TaxID=6238 RepID=A0AAE9A5X4_CAEBR|nr:hypothetical protein L3Y34_009673 [Caenorhabditis briggsae]
MTKKITESFCKICGDVSNTIRFGAVSCRACGEFFRRKVTSKSAKLPKKRCFGTCELTKQIRKTCQNCRFQKCLKSGMLEIMVESRMSIHVAESSGNILDELRNGYRNLEVARRQKFEEQNPIRFCTHQELNEIYQMDIDLIFESIIPIFQRRTRNFEMEQEKMLAENFILPFLQLETTFRSMGSTSYCLPNNAIFDTNHLDKLYMDQNTLEIVQPYWNSSNRNLKMPMDLAKLDEPEMILCSALIYWDFGINGQTDYCIKRCVKMRNLVIRELANYEKLKMGEDNCQLRIMEVMGIIQGVHRASDAVKKCGHVAKIFNLKGKECPLYEILDN